MERKETACPWNTAQSDVGAAAAAPSFCIRGGVTHRKLLGNYETSYQTDLIPPLLYLDHQLRSSCMMTEFPRSGKDDGNDSEVS